VFEHSKRKTEGDLEAGDLPSSKVSLGLAQGTEEEKVEVHGKDEI
jgi:hypothetical protein